jgi:hypothetical protein
MPIWITKPNQAALEPFARLAYHNLGLTWTHHPEREGEAPRKRKGNMAYSSSRCNGQQCGGGSEPNRTTPVPNHRPSSPSYRTEADPAPNHSRPSSLSTDLPRSRSRLRRRRRRRKGAKMFYGAMVWDPWLIVSQIVCLQCLYYLTLGVLMSLLVGTRVPRLTLLYLFDFATLTPRIPTGWCVIVSFILAAIAGYAAPPLDTTQSSSSFSLRTPGIMLV